MPRKHLDLGCGDCPRNPFGCEALYGVDIRSTGAYAATIAVANLSIEPIPFESDSFDSVSAYDFFEHVPRVSVDHAQRSSRFPFVELMNEVWRVLKPGGVLYAVTPAFPNEKAFRDPTHVNIITKKTHRYFTEPHLMARAYGFEGAFRLIRQQWVRSGVAHEPANPGLAGRLRRLADRLSGELSHLLWELAAVKPAGDGRH